MHCSCKFRVSPSWCINQIINSIRIVIHNSIIMILTRDCMALHKMQQICNNHGCTYTPKCPSSFLILTRELAFFAKNHLGQKDDFYKAVFVYALCSRSCRSERTYLLAGTHLQCYHSSCLLCTSLNSTSQQHNYSSTCKRHQ